MDWTTLTAAKTVAGSIRNWVNKAQVPVEDVIADAENWLATKLRVKDMEARAELPLALGDDRIDLAAELPRFLDPASAFLRGFDRLVYRHPAVIDRYRAVDEDGTVSAGTPMCFTIVGRPGSMIFDVEADKAYTVILTHYAKPVALSAGNPANLYTDSYSHILRLACIGWAYSHLKDEQRSQAYLASAAAAIDDLAEMDDLTWRGMMHEAA